MCTRHSGKSALRIPFLPLFFLGLFASPLYSVDPDSLRLLKKPAGAVELFWSDSTPTNFCIYRDTVFPAPVVIGETGNLSYIDSPPAAPIMFYNVDEPAGGTCARCAARDELMCGSFVAWNNGGPGSTNAIGSYPACIDWDESGPEYTYYFAPAQSQAVHVDLAGTANLDLFVLEERGDGCDPAACIVHGDRSVQFTAAGGSTYYIVVDGFQGAQGDYTLTLSCGPCHAARAVACGGTDAGNSGDPGSTRVIDIYPSCSNWIESGPEYIYSFASPQEQVVTAALSSATADLDVFILEDRGNGCDSLSCIAYGSDGAQFLALAGRIYYIAVDGYLDAVGNYTLDVSCGPPECTPDMALVCGDRDTYDNGWTGSTDLVNGYPSCTGRDESGPEYTYSFSTTANSAVTVNLTPVTGGDLDLFILQDQGSGCDPASCFAWGDTSAQFNASAGTQYYIVVDGFSGAIDVYDLSIACQ